MFSIGKMNPFLQFLLASFLFFISHSQTTSNTSSQHRCLPDQRSALLQLRQEFVEKRTTSDYYGVSFYPKMKSWKADTDCCSWDGVVCNAENGHVIDLDLSNSGLYGPLMSNSSLFSLRQLQKLNLAFNNFNSSTIPSEFGQLVRLTHLNLSLSYLTGQIPSEISWLSNLVSLDLTTFYYFQYGDDGVDHSLYLRRIDFEAFVQNMTNLRELQLAYVNISSSVPQSLVNLSSLTSLSLRNCSLLGQFPTNIFLMPKLQTINLSDNDLLTVFLPEFHSGSSLEKLHVSRTTSSGKFPNSIANLESLIELDLSFTTFSGEIPNAIGNLKSLNLLALGYCNLSGEVPLAIWNLTRLSHLDLAGNNFHGQLPSTLGNLANLTDLVLYNNLFHGEIPSSLGNLTQLDTLYLFNNSFDGRLPVSLTNLTQLKYIALAQNQLIGPIPFEIGRLPQLTSIYLSSNSLTGTIPSSLFTMTSLNDLDLSQNQLTGPLKFQNISSSQNLKYLDLSSNLFQGLLPIPPLSTKYFFASNNNLTGRIPPMICMLKALQGLDLSNNKLIGQIPHCLGDFSSSLSVLNMRNNSFQGKLPGTFTKGSNLKTLDLSLNQIKGKIPPSLVNCRMLEVLNLGNNNLNDIFPFWLESLPELRILILRANGFYGSIQSPHTNFGFSKLHVIDLSHNNFSGMLPSKYFNTWNAMQLAPENRNSKPEYMGDHSGYYADSIMVINKGMEMELVKIWTIFIAIDFSNNRFYGEIPNTMGNLKVLIVLNLSSNSFTGPIPSSFGDLTQLQSLDLSQNKFLGKIPQQLVSLTFLAYLNLSHNQLTGPIPQGRQFATFENSSFEGNSGLCGFPMSKKCGNIEIPTFEPRQESSFGEGFNWKVVVVGYASGLVIGLVLGHVIISRSPDWFARTFGVNLHK